MTPLCVSKTVAALDHMYGTQIEVRVAQQHVPVQPKKKPPGDAAMVQVYERAVRPGSGYPELLWASTSPVGADRPLHRFVLVCKWWAFGFFYVASHGSFGEQFLPPGDLRVGRGVTPVDAAGGFACVPSWMLRL